MGFIPRRRIIENLNEIEVFVEDTQNEYFIVQDIPDTFVQGRSVFKIFGSQFLKKNVPLKIEILDKNGNTLYLQPVKYGQGISPKLPFRYITVEVYPPPINVPGEAELVILGELDASKVPFNIPSQYQGTYNVKYRKKVNVDTATIINTQPILFYKKPTVSATSITTAQKKADPPANRFISGSFLYGKVNAGLKGKIFATGSTVNLLESSDEGGKSDTPSGDIKTDTNLWKYKTGLYSKRAVLNRRGVSEERDSPEPPQMTLTSTVANSFNTKMVGGDIEVHGIDLPATVKKQYSGLPLQTNAVINSKFTFPRYKARIESVISDTKLTTSKPYGVAYKFGPEVETQGIYSDIGSPIPADNLYANFTASYVDWNVPATSSYRFDTFIDVDISNMRTFSGDVYRMKVYGASDSSQGDFPVLLDTIVESSEQLVDTNVAVFPLRSGYLQSQAHIDKYWDAYGGDNATPTLQPQYTMSLADSVYLSGSYDEYNTVGRFELNSDYSFTVKRDVPYTLSFNAYGKKTLKTINTDGEEKNYGKLMVHLSGSNIAGDSRLNITHKTDFGQSLTNATNQKVGLELKNNDPDSLVEFPRISHTFYPKFKLDKIKNDDTILQFRIEAGEWYISDISLRPAQDTGFSPDEVKLRVPVGVNTLRPDNFDLLLEYYDINGNTAEAITFVNNVGISGSALVVEGNDNMLTGSLFIGNVQGAGIEMAGSNSAYMRSIGYVGFTSASLGTPEYDSATDGVNSGLGGFMIWSGSVLPDAPDNYAGAGLEIHDGNTGINESYFKYRTIDPVNDNSASFDVRTSRFFFGSEDAGNFISGSNGNIEITSSNFHLQPDGDVVMKGTITAEAGGTIGGFTINSTDLTGGSGGSTIKLASGVGIHMGNASLASAPFSVTNAGVLKATSGTVGGWTIASDKFSSGTDSDFIGLIPGTGIQLGDSTFADAPFTVSPAGAVSASSGNVGGWAISDSQISSGNLIIHNSGDISTSDYDPQFTGWIISAKANGFAEFENMRIRGTLRTAVFEKETVNAVGGQLWLANSTVVTQSVAQADDFIVVENASGFMVDEIIFAKKVNGQGFSKEFMKITSMSREDSSSDDNFVGTLFVDRDTNQISSSFTSSISNLNGAINAEQTELTIDDNAPVLDRSIIKVDFEYMKVTGSRGDTKIQVLRGADGSQKVAHSDNAVVGQLSRDAAMVASFLSPRETYTPGQVLVSTGRFMGGEGNNTTGSGYMLLNSNPTTGDTPYMDFAERTGSGVYDIRLKTRLGDLSGLIKSRFGREVGISDDPGFGLASENVFLSGMIRANSGSIGGISMGNEKIFTEGGGGAHGDLNTGFFASASGDFSLGSSVIWTKLTDTLSISGSGVDINTNTIDVLTDTLELTSGGSGRLSLGTSPPTSVGTDGIFLSGSGHFSMQSSSNAFMRLDEDGFQMTFPSFSVSPAGFMSATDGIFKGNISATTGFIGASTGSGWNIDGSTIGDVNNVIQLDSSANSPNITITSGSFVAELVPDFTPASVILNAGGNTYNSTNLTDASWDGSAFTNDNTNIDTNTTNITTGGTSAALELFGGFTGTGGGTASTHTTLGSITEVTLSGGTKAYKSTATIRVSIAIDTVQHSAGSSIEGTTTVGGNITLRDEDDNAVATQALSGGHLIDNECFAETTRVNKNFSVAFTHTVATDTTDYYFEIDDVTVTNNGMTESHIVGGKTITSTPDITAIAAYFTAMAHQPSNKKTEIAPAGIQSVFLANATLENANTVADGGNAFVRISPEEPKTFEVLGTSFITGSLIVREHDPANADQTTIGSDITTTGHIQTSEYILTATGTQNVPAVQLGSANDGFYHLASGDVGINVIVDNTQAFLFGDNEAFHAGNDITAFSSTVASDIRLKENIKPLENNLDKILELKPSSFTWKVRDKQDDVGLIAQEVESVIPMIVKETISIGKTKKFLDGDTHKTVDYSKLTTYLIGAVQEQQTQINELKKKLEEL